MKAYTLNEMQQLYENEILLKDLKMSIKLGHAATGTPFFYFDPKNSTFLGKEYTDIYKKHGAIFASTNGFKAWVWYIGKKENFPTEDAMRAQERKIYNTRIIPFIQDMAERVASKDNTSLPPDVEKKKQELISAIEQAISTLKQVKTDTSISQQTAANIDEIEQKLHGFVEDIINTFDADEIIEKIERVVQFKGSQGIPLSMNNTILTFIQDPKATMVKALGRWSRDLNRTVNQDAIIISLIRPETRKKSDKECNEITEAYLLSLKKNSVDDLDLEEKETLERKFYFVLPGRYASYNACDIRFTTQMDGKESKIDATVVEKPVYANLDKREWRDLSKIDPNVKPIYSAGEQIAKSIGVTVIQKTPSQLGGSTGVSYGNGVIEIMQNNGDNVGITKTLFHELAHSILHQKYVNSDIYNRVGTRGDIEQQAELTALLVMRSFGYNLPTSINYVKMWGGTKSNIIGVFDIISEVTNYLVRSVDSILKGGKPLPLKGRGDKAAYAMKKRLGESLEEDTELRNENHHEDITPEEIADFVGIPNLYKKLKRLDIKKSEG